MNENITFSTSAIEAAAEIRVDSENVSIQSMQERKVIELFAVIFSK